MKRITFSVYAVFPLPSRTELRPVCFSAEPTEEIPGLREKSKTILLCSCWVFLCPFSPAKCGDLYAG